ncbi:right-handed parallel beta-helix repeat-containing protein [Hymenobacter jeollabukensis]|uniref:Right-handed parallel beta-helix repeat-containing protein n=1 Tax=Hymenobacter jeollabukensis TaxID=2025313 RepID=A0A5R8WWE8_9BACT|nr:right-handed parallel beta-helix repeat-containing protein [Hymenobacter jeollabukensis]TLM96796.1 right-handed parallel beta-helix repeat-containing protein [Hymenobacter jeollabukensis]
MKTLSTLLLLAVGAAACSKHNDPTLSPELTAKSQSAKVSTTVTTESALRTAIGNAKPGDIITVSGTIRLTSTLQCLNSGTSSAKINFAGGTLDCSGIASGWGVKVNGSYWNITNMVIKNAPDCGLVFQQGGYNYVYKVTTTANKDSGLQVYNGAHDNNISYCTSTENFDTANNGENADGFACKLSAGRNNKFDHCTANHNSDDGWDLYGQPYTVTITNCTATNNGYGGAGDGNGFKLGSAGQTVAHTATGCTSSYNKASGYDGNGNTGHITTTGSGGTGNGKMLFYRIY